MKQLQMLLCTIACLCPGLAFAGAADLDLLVTPSARDVHKNHIYTTAATQLSYTAHTAFPSVAVSARQLRALQRRGWRPCGKAPTWIHFVDRTVEPNRIVHQRITKFRKDNEFLELAFRYLSSVPQDGTIPAKSDSNVQHVLALHYDLSDSRLRQQIEESDKDCFSLPMPKN